MSHSIVSVVCLGGVFSTISSSLFAKQLDRSKMSDAATAPAAPAKVTKKRAGGSAKAKKPASHPTYSDMVKSALTALKVRNLSVYEAENSMCRSCRFIYANLLSI